MEDTSRIIKLWVDKYSSDMLSWAFYKTAHRETAEDLVQDTFICAFQAFHTFEHKSKPKTWLFAILKNKITDFHRSNYKSTVISSCKTGEEEQAFLCSYAQTLKNKKDYTSKNLTEEVAELMDNPEFNQVFITCIQKLPPLWNSVIQLKYLEEKDTVTICEQLGVSSTNYWQIIHRAKRQLREYLEFHWFEKFENA